MEKKRKYSEIAIDLSVFIAKNWHYCPIPEDVNVEDCEYWGSDKCAKCIRKHSDHL